MPDIHTMLSDRERSILLNLRKLGSPHCDERGVERELALARRHQTRILTPSDAEYPAALREIHDPTLALYLRGHVVEEDDIAVAIVGARRASPYGLQSAERLAYDLALRGVTIVSGLARRTPGGGARRGAPPA